MAIISDRIRVGGIDYLNAQPLLWGLDGAPELDVRRHRPSELAALLASGRLDVALVPVVACADRDDYVVLPDICIASHGPVRSIRLYHRGPLERVRRVALDTSSRTSAFLARLLFRSLWDADPEFVDVSPSRLRVDLAGAASQWDAALLIGDDALSCGVFPGWRDIDLGSAWTRWTGRPFVYAFWALRRSAAARFDDDIVDLFLRARVRGFAHIDDIVREFRRPSGMSETDCRHYLAHVIQYDLRDDKIAGWALFAAKLRASGLLDLPPLELLPVSAAIPPAARTLERSGPTS